MKAIASLMDTAALLCASNAAMAIPIRVTGGGVFTESEMPLVIAGTEWSIDLTYESSAPDVRPDDPADGFYRAFQSLRVSVGDAVYTLDDLEIERSGIQIFNDRPISNGEFFRDVVRIRGAISSTLLGFDMSTDFGSPERGAGPLESDALISDAALLQSMYAGTQDPYWYYTDFVFYELQPGQTLTDVFAVGTVDSFSASPVSVPEPGTFSLLTPALLTIMGLGRRRHLQRKPNQRHT